MNGRLTVRQLRLAFESKNASQTVVDDLTFELIPGETLALLGESGCGKSLTSLALMRLLPTDAGVGEESQVLFCNDDLLTLPECVMRQYRGKKIAMIFQEPMTTLNPVLTIGEQLSESLSHELTLNAVKKQERMIELLTELQISEPEMRLKQYPHQLSGGQQQRVVIAMAIAGRPDILVADEPTTALDVTTQARILENLKALQSRYQMSLLLVTHDVGVVAKMADRVLVMYAGQCVEMVRLDPFLRQPLHPYAQQLLASLPSYAKRGERLQAIPGSVPTLEDRPSGCRFHPRCAHAFETCRATMPSLQSLDDDRMVRCHLYPARTSPPPLPVVVSSWTSSETSHETILVARDVSVYFQPKRDFFSMKPPPFKAVDSVSFTLHRGKTLALVGESGCGKSTLCKAILRLQLMTSGDIEFQGASLQSLHGRGLREYRKKVQIIFQDPFSSMNPRMTIAAILAEGMEAQGMSKAAIQARLWVVLDYVGLAKNSLTRYPHQFSGGQRQRIGIARALATEPTLLVCDEPTSALDISIQAQILNLLKTLQIELGLSYFFITHNMSVVSYIADDVLVMKNGRIVEAGTCEQILTNPRDPYTTLLLRS